MARPNSIEFVVGSVIQEYLDHGGFLSKTLPALQIAEMFKRVEPKFENISVAIIARVIGEYQNDN